MVESIKEDSKALLIFHNRVEEQNFPKISIETTTYQAWEILETSYQGTDKVKNSINEESVLRLFK